MNLFVTWFLITNSAKLQLNDMIALSHLSFSNLLLSNELPYNFHFLCKIFGCLLILNLNTLLVKSQIDNSSPGAVTGGN